MKHVVIAGASGLTGSFVLKELAKQSDIVITSLVRKNAGSSSTPSLTEVLFDFDNQNDYKKLGSEIVCDVFFCCIGTTYKKAKTNENFLKIDRDYPIQFINSIKKNNPNCVFVFISSIGVRNARGLYLTAKCEVEKNLTQSLLPYVIVRPSVLLGSRRDFRPAEMIGGFFFNKVNNLIKKFKIEDAFSISKFAPIHAEQLARTMVHYGLKFDRTVPGVVLEGESLIMNEQS